MSDAEFEDTTAIVLDNGSGTIKAGFAGEEEPKLIFPSFKRPKPTIGYAAIGYNGLCYDPSMIKPKYVSEYDKLMQTHPIQQGVIVNWDQMVPMWTDTFTQLGEDCPDENTVLLTEKPLTPKANREKKTQLMFETFEVPGFYVATDAVLALYAAGRTTGIVINSGYGITDISPIYEGYTLPHVVQRLKIAGIDITLHLQRILKETVPEKNILLASVKEIKDKFCYIAHEEKKQELSTDNNSDCQPSNAVTYELPDGTNIQIGNDQRFRAPEILFEPNQTGIEEDGIHKLTFKAIMKCDVDIRNDLYDNIVMSGGCTMFKGMKERFTSEICGLAPELTKIKVIAPPERLNSVWIGGSIVASLSTFEEEWIAKWEYDEAGPSIVHRKCTT